MTACPRCTGYMLDHPEALGWKKCSCGYCKRKEVKDAEVKVDISSITTGRCLDDDCTESHQVVLGRKYCTKGEKK